MPDVLGIDISYHQTKTPSLTGLAFLFARASIGVTGDLAYAKHIAAAKQAGLVTGAYHFGVNASASLQAATFLHAAGDVDFYALDLEGANPMTTAQARAFIAAVQQAGHECGLYHSQSGFPNLGQDWNWVASWSNPPTSAWRFWQYRGSPLDLDRFNGTLAQLRALGTQQAPNQGAPMHNFALRPGPVGSLVVKGTGHYYMSLVDGVKHGPIDPATFGVRSPAYPITLIPPIDGGKGDRSTGYLIGTNAAFLLASDVTFIPAPVPVADCSAAVKAAVDPLEAQILDLTAKLAGAHERQHETDVKAVTDASTLP